MSSFFRYFLFPAWFLAAAFFGLSCDSHEFANTKHFYTPHHGGGHGDHAAHGADHKGAAHGDHKDHGAEAHADGEDHKDHAADAAHAAHGKDKDHGHVEKRAHPTVMPKETKK